MRKSCTLQCIGLETGASIEPFSFILRILPIFREESALVDLMACCDALDAGRSRISVELDGSDSDEADCVALRIDVRSLYTTGTRREGAIDLRLRFAERIASRGVCERRIA
jgi:hypothetical protein